jgi:hypothetical protein
MCVLLVVKSEFVESVSEMTSLGAELSEKIFPFVSTFGMSSGTLMVVLNEIP